MAKGWDGGKMSGVEWTIVTVIGVCLILVFVLLEILFPVADMTDHPFADDNARDHKPVIRSADSRT